MLHRSLDVIFQYLGRLVLVLVLVPAAVLAVGIAADQTELVTARLWADDPAVLADSPYSQAESGVTPAQHQATLLSELLQTDSFVSAVLRNGQLSGRPADITAVGVDLRRNLAVSPLGPHVVLITYATAHSGQGLVMTRAVVSAFEQAQVGVQTGQVTVADEALATQLKAARKDMDDAIAAVQQYQSAQGNSTSLASDATFQSLRTLATGKVTSYASLVEQADKAAQYRSAIPAVQTSVLRTMDPPRVTARQFNPKGPATKNAIYALVAVLAMELAFVYNVTRRDQRVRTTRDVAASLEVLSLGTVPDPRAR